MTKRETNLLEEWRTHTDNIDELTEAITKLTGGNAAVSALVYEFGLESRRAERIKAELDIETDTEALHLWAKSREGQENA